MFFKYLCIQIFSLLQTCIDVETTKFIFKYCFSATENIIPYCILVLVKPWQNLRQLKSMGVNTGQLALGLALDLNRGSAGLEMICIAISSNCFITES